MRLRFATALASSTVLALVFLTRTAVVAHHSFAPYEPTLQIKLSGVVTVVQVGEPPRVHRDGRARREDGREAALAGRVREHEHPQPRRMAVQHAQAR